MANTTDPGKFDAILDVTDPDFLQKLRAALDLRQDEYLNLILPQFTRTDGKRVVYVPKTKAEYAALPHLPPDLLRSFGCQPWDEENPTLWLFPGEWYWSIPENLEVVDILGNTERFIRGVTDDDIRCGALSFGFRESRRG